MFGSVKKHIDNPTGDIETIIGKETTITGQLQGSCNIRIDGRIDGGIFKGRSEMDTRFGSAAAATVPAN